MARAVLLRRAHLLSPMIRPKLGILTLASLALAVMAVPLRAAAIDPYYAGSYTMTDLGVIGGIPGPLGGLTVLAGDNNTLLLGGSANSGAGAIYSVGVTRDSGGHITGFTGPASLYSSAPWIDGGLTYGPGGVLFYTGYPTNQIGQIKPGSVAPDRVDVVTSLGISSSVGALMFVPAGHPGAGQLKVVSYNTGNWYSVGISPDGSGTYNLSSATYHTTIGGGPEGIAYVPTGSALFTVPSLLVAEWGAGNVVTYETDANGDPITSSRRMFISGLSGAEGSLIDPVTGDFLFSTFGGGDHVVRVSGFERPPPPSPVPDGGVTLLLLGVAMSALGMWRKRAA